MEKFELKSAKIKDLNNLYTDTSLISNNLLNETTDCNTNDLYYKNEHDSLNDSKNVEKKTFCIHCFNPLNIFQINFNIAIQICTNLECVQYGNRLEKFDISSCVLSRDYKSIKPNEIEIENKDAQFDQLVQKLIDTEKELLNVDRFKNLDFTKKKPELDAQSHKDQLIQQFDLTDNFINQVPLTNTIIQESNHVVQPLSAQLKEIVNPVNTAYQIGPPAEALNNSNNSNNMLDYDFMFELDGYLINDVSDLTLPLANTNPISQTDQLCIDDMKSNGNTNLLSHDTPTEQTNELEFDFLGLDDVDSQNDNSTLDNKDSNPTSNVRSLMMPEFDSKGNKVLAYGKTESGKSSITISKLKRDNKEEAIANKSKRHSNKHKLEIIDDNEEIMDLINQQEKNKKLKPNEKKLDEFKSDLSNSSPIFMPKANKTSDKLLPWEIKNKSNARQKANNDSEDGVKSPIKSLPQANKSLEFSSSPRINQGSITKADLSHKANSQKNALKERGTFLKDILLKDNTFLSNLNDKSLNKPLNGSGNGVSSGTGGYKDLILSVLKKKTTA